MAEENKRNMIEGLNYLQTVGGGNKGFSEFQYERALVARKIYHMVGAPIFLTFKMMIRHNIIHNFPVMVEDIKKRRRYLILVCIP